MLKKGYQSLWWLVLLLSVIMILSSFSSVFMTEIFGEKYNTVFMFFLEFTIAVPCFIGYLIAKKDTPDITPADLGIRPIKHEYILYAALMPIFFQNFCIATTIPAQLTLSALFGSDMPDIPIPDTVADTVFTVISVCVLAPVFEEFLFRGVMVRLMRKYSFTAAMLTTSAAFAVQHMDMMGIVQYFFLGMLLFLMRYSTGSLFTSIIAHSMVNLSALISAYAFEKNLTAVMKLSNIIMITSFIAAPLLLRHFLRLTEYLENWRKNVKLKGDKLGFSAALIIFMIIYTLFNSVTLISNIESGYTQKSFSEFFEDDTLTEEELLN